jgi:hypothetical protein
MQKLVKFAGLLVGIVVADIIIFSPGFIGVSF